MRGDVDMLHLLLAAAGDPNKGIQNGSSPAAVHVAAKNGHVKMLQLLLLRRGMRHE